MKALFDAQFGALSAVIAGARGWVENIVVLLNR